MAMAWKDDAAIIERNLQSIPRQWDGKECVLELKEADYQWRQMEWWAFYFEYKVKRILSPIFSSPGAAYGNVSFDLRRTINWDVKASAIKTSNHSIILNDVDAMNRSIHEDGFHGEIIGLCDVEYNDQNRSFQKWHTELKGGPSSYEIERITRTAVSRYRKTRAVLLELVLIVLCPDDLEYLHIMKQGRNSNGSTRRAKYMLDLSQDEHFCFLRHVYLNGEI